MKNLAYMLIHRTFTSWRISIVYMENQNSNSYTGSATSEEIKRWEEENDRPHLISLMDRLQYRD